MNKMNVSGSYGAALAAALATLLLAACEPKPVKPTPSNPNVTSSVNPPTPATPTIAPTR